MIEKQRALYCNRCQEIRDFTYSHTDQDAKHVWGRDSVDVYNCNVCRNTQAMHHRPDLGDKMESPKI